MDAEPKIEVPTADTLVDRGTKAAKEIAALSADDRTVLAIIPRTVEEAFRYAQIIIAAGLCPDSYCDKAGGRDVPNPQKVVVGILKGLEVGFPPITALSTIAIINNRPCIWGDGAVALCQSRGVIERIEQTWEGGKELPSAPILNDRGEQDYSPQLTDFPDTLTAVVRIWRRGHSSPYEGMFSVRDARRAHLWGNPKKAPWVMYPKRMLFNRARAFPLRDGFADCLAGLSIAEEIRDLPEAAPAVTDVSFLSDEPLQITAQTETPLGIAISTEAEVTA